MPKFEDIWFVAVSAVMLAFFGWVLHTTSNDARIDKYLACLQKHDKTTCEVLLK